MAINVTPIQDSTSFLTEGNPAPVNTFQIPGVLSPVSYIELFIGVEQDEYGYFNYSYDNFQPISTQLPSGSSTTISDIEINPENDYNEFYSNDDLFSRAQSIFYLHYNFFDKEIGSPLEQLYISDISPDRKQVSINSFDIDSNILIEQTNKFIQKREDLDYFLEFYLNFGLNSLSTSVNIKLDTSDPEFPTVIVKLKEPLSENIDINDILWIVTQIEESRTYELIDVEEPVTITDTFPIQGPNFNLGIKSQVNNSTNYLSYADLITTTSTSSFNQLSNLLEKKELNINVDYTNFSDFIHFSSAKTRLENFISKVKLIESYSSSLSILDNTSNTNNISSSKSSFEGKTNKIISNFDGYEYYLYFNTGSFSYPKTSTQIPYTLAKSDSTEVENWLGNIDELSPLYGGLNLSASLYDESNRNHLLKSIPEYLKDNPNNQLYELFVDMVAQYYDNIWIYIKDITKKYDNDNRLDFGVSKDLVADAIRDFGVKLYQNNFSNDDLFTAFLGLTPNGSLFPYPNMTGSLPTPTGFEYVNTLISASNDILPQEDVNKSLYKRIYHNLPYLLSSKGTIPGLRALITSYGIPDTILRISEYGGKDKIDSNDWDHWQNEFNYAFNTSGSNFISSSWELNSSWNSTDNVPETLMFRFKTNGLPTSGSYFYSQSLWSGNGSTDTSIVLEYTGSGYTSGSYNGSIKDPNYQYANLKFFPDNSQSSTSASVYLPFFDGEWWSVMVKWDGDSSWDLYSGNNLYEGGDNNTSIGFFESSSVTGNKTPWVNTDTSFFPISFSVSTAGGYDIVTYDDTAIYDGTSGTSGIYSAFSGSYQEIRYYAAGINENVFKDYVMNPYSIEGNTLNSSPNELAFRASIGGELYTGSNSIHPKITGSWLITQSFSTGLSSFYYDNTPNFITNKEFFFVDQPVAGIKNVIGDKIRVEDNSFPGGFPTSSVLSPYESVLQQTNASQSYTTNINYLEVAFSPQNQINEDIMSQLGFFNIGEYIGDPRLRSSSADSYPDLDKLRNDYFQKYIKNYDIKDFIRLIKFFDNSLFKMIKDFIPARTSLASGLVIKQHLLERNKYPTPQPNINTTIAKYAKSGSIIYNQPIQQKNLLISGAVLPQSRNYDQGTIVKTEGGTGGVFDRFNNLNTSPYGVSGSGPTNNYFLTQSWNETINSPFSGSLSLIVDNQNEFYDGEFSGSYIQTVTQSLAHPYPIILTGLQYKPIIYSNTNYGLDVFSDYTANNFQNPSIRPNQGEVLIQMPYSKTVFFTFMGATAAFPVFVTTSPFMKIHKDDCDLEDQRLPLQNCTSLKIQRQGLNIYDEYRVKNRTELADYYLFELENTVGSSTGFGSGRYSEVKNYKVDANGGTAGTLGPQSQTIDDYSSVPVDTLSYFNALKGIYTLGNEPNIPLSLSGSATIGGSGTGTLRIIRNIDKFGSGSILATGTATAGNTALVDTIISGSINDTFCLTIEAGSPSTTFGVGTFDVTQSVEPSSSLCLDVFLDPYVTQNNYLNSDFNPLMNNVMENRKNTIYQDVDYSLGVKPVNFDFLISGSAVKFPIPDSHFTQKSSIIPRYEGAKTTSLFPNKWTKQDSGTYGKTPTLDILETKLIYADWIGGYPPEHMNASGIHIQYIINEDGTIKIPNTSENSLEDVQQSFMSNKVLEINSNTIGTGEPSPMRNIIRGGYRIEPVLYTQYGHSPALFNVTASFTGDFVSDQSTVNNYTITTKPGASEPQIPLDTYAKLDFAQIVNQGNGASYSSGEYVVTQESIDENITLDIGANIRVYVKEGSTGAQTYTFYVKLVKERGGVISNLGGFLQNSEDLQLGQTGANLYYSAFRDRYDEDTAFSYNAQSPLTFPLGIQLQPQDLQVGDKIYVQGKHQVPQPNTGVTGGDVRFQPEASSFFVNQQPISTDTEVSSSGTNTIWGYPSTTNLTAITASNTNLNAFYGRGYKMNNTVGYVTGSGFGTVSLDWELKIGDEFRFEGNENNVFMVKKVYGLSETDGNRISQTGSLEVQFNGNLPSSSIDLDHFLIRRYIPDASQILMQGFKPTNAVGPYIIRPQYISSKLNKGVDDYILDLTSKGLI